MKTKINNILLIGGFYFIASFLLNYINISYLTILSLVCLFMLIIFTIFKKRIHVLEKLSNKHPSFYNYILLLGVVQYIGAVIFSIVTIDGYNYAKAMHGGYEYKSFYVNCEEYINIFYYFLIVLALLFATYKSFFKKMK